ncbi:ABC transporter substrate-binding protein [Bacillus manliponensis]|uniref:SgrR family transcriptional regulator n=1 Tax=Bacillus manliponensis TaxID=574376 RepID=UPI0035199099
MKEGDFSPFKGGRKMVILEQYVQLWIKYMNNERTDKKLEISIQNISETLFCTTRNSKFIIKRLEELEWICWQPGRGRGKRSTIVFLKEPNSLVLEIGKEIVKKGDINDGRTFVKQYDSYFPHLSHQFEGWIESLFGHQVEVTKQGRQDILRLQANIKCISNFDPTLISLRSDCHVAKHVYDTLVYFNIYTGVIEPRLAFHWEYENGRMVWTFYLRKGVVFHNGTIFTAKDVIYTFERFLNKKNNPYIWMLEHIKEIRELNEYTVEIHLHKENALFLQILSTEQCSIIKKDNRQNLIGTGPFIVQTHNEKKLILEAHHSYFRERPFLDCIEFWKEAEQKEEYDIFSSAQYRNEQHYQNLSEVERNVTYVTLNVNKIGPMQDKTFRKALHQIIHKNKLIEDLAGNRDEVANEFLLGKTYKAKKEDIHELIKSSVYNGETLLLYTFTDKDHVEDGEWIQQECKKYGISIELHFLEAKELLQEKVIREADVIHDSATISEQLEMSFLFLFLAKNSFIHQHSSILFQEQLTSFFTEQSRGKRLTILGGIESNLLEHIHIIPLYRNKQEVLTHEKVQNAVINSQGWIDFYNIWFKS